VQLYGHDGSLMSLTPPQRAARCAMCSAQRYRCSVPHLPFFCGMFEGETGNYVCFFCRKLLTGGGARTCIGYQ
jgi:hypothetical protein